MKQDITISVIIPHYNIPEMLVRALRTIPQREDVQVIVVDDGSDDNIGEVVDRFKNEDCTSKKFRENVEFYPQPHSGFAGRMRNIGLEHAKGEWVTFLDADDFFSENADRIFTEVQQYSEDIVFYRSIAVMNDDLTKPSGRNGFDVFFSIEDKAEQERYFRYVYTFPIGKFVRRELIERNHCQFEEVPHWNDVYFCTCIGIYAKDIRVCQDVLYVITERNESLTGNAAETKSERLKKNYVRYGVTLRAFRLLRKHKIYMPVDAYHLTRAVGLFRSKDKKDYFLLLSKMLFIYPPCTFYFIRKDIRTFWRKVFKIGD